MTQAGGQKRMSEDQGGDGERVVLRTEKPRPQTKMSQQQKELLVWIYRQEYRDTHGLLQSTAILMAENVAYQQELMAYNLRHMFAALGEPPPPPPRRRRTASRGVKWSAERYLGRKPVKTKQKQESMELSRRMDSLERRGLIRRSKSGRNTTHVKLTAAGSRLAIILVEQGH
jgi:hypothetical protein